MIEIKFLESDHISIHFQLEMRKKQSYIKTITDYYLKVKPKLISTMTQERR